MDERRLWQHLITIVIVSSRFQYLHGRLSHIKRLVSDFDMTITKGNGRMQAQPTY